MAITTTPTPKDDGGAGKDAVARIGVRAPDFSLDRPLNATTLLDLAQRARTVVLITLDSYRFHGT
ncbi:MAG: hypothetical protein GEU73_06855 [Chloroflexi bacterium]|nr:hypothetical protein [Chloroflexota bacterium]